MEDTDINFYNAITDLQNNNNCLDYVFIGTNSNPSPIHDTSWLYSITENDRVYGTEPFPNAYFKCLDFLLEYPKIKSKILNFAISDKNKVCKLYQGVSDWVSGKKTGIHGSLIDPKDSMGEYNNDMYIEVAAITFEYFVKLLDIKKIDVLIVDVEGYEFEILKQCLLLGFYPKLIYYEEFNMKPDQKDLCYGFMSTRYQITKCKFDNLCILKQ